MFENIFITLDALPGAIPKGLMSTSGIEPGRLGDCTLELHVRVNYIKTSHLISIVWSLMAFLCI